MALQTDTFTTQTGLEHYGRSSPDFGYQTPFSSHPDLKTIFSKVCQGNEEHTHALNDKVLPISRNIQSSHALLQTVSHFTSRHASSAGEPWACNVFENAPLATIPHELPLTDGNPTLSAKDNACQVWADLYIQADSAIEQSLHELPDQGYLSNDNDTRTCSNCTDEQLNITVVAERVDEMPDHVIPMTNPVQIHQYRT